jgi:hypothetical protein
MRTRRRFTAKSKAKVALEAIQGHQTVAELAARASGSWGGGKSVVVRTAETAFSQQIEDGNFVLSEKAIVEGAGEVTFFLNRRNFGLDRIAKDPLLQFAMLPREERNSEEAQAK